MFQINPMYKLFVLDYLVMIGLLRAPFCLAVQKKLKLG